MGDEGDRDHREPEHGQPPVELPHEDGSTWIEVHRDLIIRGSLPPQAMDQTTSAMVAQRGAAILESGLVLARSWMSGERWRSHSHTSSPGSRRAVLSSRRRAARQGRSVPHRCAQGGRRLDHRCHVGTHARLRGCDGVPRRRGLGHALERTVDLDRRRGGRDELADGDLTGERFESLVGTTVREAAQSGRDVSVYGEIVAVLWDRGHVVPALDLDPVGTSSATRRRSRCCAPTT